MLRVEFRKKNSMFEKEIEEESASTEPSLFEKVLVSMDLSPATESLVSALQSQK